MPKLDQHGDRLSPSLWSPGAGSVIAPVLSEPPLPLAAAMGMDRMSTRTAHTLEQMDRYRSGATDAANLAKPCEDAELRDAYLSIARTWTELANKLERDLRSVRGKPVA